MHPQQAERGNKANHFVTTWLNQDGLSLPDALYRTTEEKDKSTTMINACSNWHSDFKELWPLATTNLDYLKRRTAIQ